MIRATDRVAIFGRTGSGKTTLVRRLLRSVPRYAVLDPKGQYTAPGTPIRRRYDPRVDRVIYRAPIYGRGEMEWYDDLILRLTHDGDTIIVLDEAAYVSRPYPTSAGLARALRTGRSRGVGVWSCTQRPMRVPGEILSESEHFIIFHLQYLRDRKKVLEFTGDAVAAAMERLRRPGHRHDFLHYDVSENHLTYWNQLYKKE